MNPIRKKLSSHAAKGYSRITAAEADLKEIYLRARDYVERQLATFLQQKNASFTGPRLVSLFDDISSYFSDFEQEYCETYEEALSYMAKQNYAVALHDMGLEENIVGSMDKALFENMRSDAFSHIAGATRKMQTDVISNLRKMSARVMREASLTGMTRSEVSRKLAFENGYGTGSLFQQTGKKGSDFQFIDAAGKQWKTDAYFNMLGRTLLHNNARECYLAGCAKAGSDIVTISISGDPCEVCAKYENTLLSISGRTKGLVTLEQAMAEGLFHPNCTHRMVAVPESVAKEYYTESGEEKAEKNVAWEKKLGVQEQTEKRQAVPESHEEHLKRRKEQEQRAYENRMAKWIKEMKNTGVDDRVINTLADIYTPEMAKLGKPPRIVLSSSGSQHYNRSRNEMQLHPQMTENDSETLQHEMTHWWHYGIIKKHPEIQLELKKAAKMDLKRIKKLYSKSREDFMFSNDAAKNKAAQQIFHVDTYESLTMEEQRTILNFFNSVGSLSSGKLGGLHGKTYATIDDLKENKKYFNAQNTSPFRCHYGEVVAELCERFNHKEDKLRLAFPEVWIIVKKYRGD